MGIAFITTKAGKFDQETDKAFEDEIASGNLLSGLPETIQHLFRCNSTSDEFPQIGAGVLLYDKGSQIDVVINNKGVGIVMASDTRELKKIMAHVGTEVFTAQVVEVQVLSKNFIVQLTMPQI